MTYRHTAVTRQDSVWEGSYIEAKERPSAVNIFSRESQCFCRK